MAHPWQGRCLYYSEPSHWDDALSDHKVYMASLSIECEEASNSHMAPTRSYLKPDGLPPEVWRQTIARHWKHASAIPATTTEEERYSFNNEVEECLQRAATEHGCRTTETRRPKGTAHGRYISHLSGWKPGYFHCLINAQSFGPGSRISAATVVGKGRSCLAAQHPTHLARVQTVRFLVSSRATFATATGHCARFTSKI